MSVSESESRSTNQTEELVEKKARSSAVWRYLGYFVGQNNNKVTRSQTVKKYLRVKTGNTATLFSPVKQRLLLELHLNYLHRNQS